MPTRKLKEFLDRNHVMYVTISHSPAYTAQTIAQIAHISGKELAKTVIIKVDGALAMAVLPATYRVDLEVLKDVLKSKNVELAGEADFQTAFPGCELGAMPPFGNLWHVPVYVAEQLTEDEMIAFNAGTHTELVQMDYEEFARLVKPTVIPMTHVVSR